MIRQIRPKQLIPQTHCSRSPSPEALHHGLATKFKAEKRDFRLNRAVPQLSGCQRGDIVIERDCSPSPMRSRLNSNYTTVLNRYLFRIIVWGEGVKIGGSV